MKLSLFSHQYKGETIIYLLNKQSRKKRIKSLVNEFTFNVNSAAFGYGQDSKPKHSGEAPQRGFGVGYWEKKQKITSIARGEVIRKPPP